jgi:hypothetical protein
MKNGPRAELWAHLVDLRPEVGFGVIRFSPFFGERDLASGKENQEGTFPAILPVNPL